MVSWALSVGREWPPQAGGHFVLFRPFRHRTGLMNDREQALILAETRWHTVFDEAPIGLAEMGPDGAVIQANQALADLLEVSRADLAGAYLTDYSHPDDRVA